MSKDFGYGSAPGKVIISGDHSVVYGYPAIATALDLRCNVTITATDPGLVVKASDMDLNLTYTTSDLQDVRDGKLVHNKFDGLARIFLRMISEDIAFTITIESEIPISAGLGSSAAVAVATVAAIADYYDMKIGKKKISEIAFESEQLVHGKPSGIDNSIATYGGLLVFQKGNIELMELSHDLPMIIVNSKVPRDTKKLVAGVGQLNENYPIIESILENMGQVTNNVIKEIESGDLKKLGDLININQGLLDTIGVGHPLLSELIWKLRGAGALGAKLTGAGGGGCMFALLDNEVNSDMMAKAIENFDVDIIVTKASSDGVKIGGSKE